MLTHYTCVYLQVQSNAMISEYSLYEANHASQLVHPQTCDIHLPVACVVLGDLLSLALSQETILFPCGVETVFLWWFSRAFLFLDVYSVKCLLTGRTEHTRPFTLSVLMLSSHLDRKPGNILSSEFVIVCSPHPGPKLTLKGVCSYSSECPFPLDNFLPFG